MLGGQEADVRAQHHVVANRHRAGVQDGQVKVGVKIIADGGEAPVVKLDWPLQVDILPVSAQQFRENGRPLFGLIVVGQIVIVAEPVALARIAV